MNFSNEWAKIHTWYKALIVILFLIITFTISLSIYEFSKDMRSDNGPGWLMVSFIFIFALILFHFIIYKGVYLNFYSKKQYNRCLKEINDLTLLLQQKIVTEKEYEERTSILKNELLKYHA